MPFADPLSNLSQLELEPGKNLADFGVGGGAYTLPAAAILKPGKVYAVEIQTDLLTRLKTEVERLGLDNVEYIWGDIEEPGGSKLGDATVDYIIISNLLFLADKAYQVALEAKRILRPGGKILIIDWSTDSSKIAPRSFRTMDSGRAKEIFNQAGLVLTKEFSAGDHHFGLVFRKNS